MHHEAAQYLFTTPVVSPYMSFAPTLKHPKKYPEMCLHDGSVFVQTVQRHQDPWLYAVLQHLQNSTGLAAVLSVEFVEGAKPPSSVVDALRLWDTETAINVMVVEDWIFTERVQTKGGGP